MWCTSETDPRVVSARSVAYEAARQNRAPHLVWNPWSGDTVQLVPATRAAAMLPAPIGSEGRVCMQILVVGRAREPFTNGPLKGLDEIVCWLDTWGIARRWPAGPPLPSPQSYLSSRQRRAWARGGHFGASQVPGCDRLDPGGLDIRRITGQQTPVAEIPRPRIPAGEPPPALRPRRLAKPTKPVLSHGSG